MCPNTTLNLIKLWSIEAITKKLYSRNKKHFTANGYCFSEMYFKDKNNDKIWYHNLFAQFLTFRVHTDISFYYICDLFLRA